MEIIKTIFKVVLRLSMIFCCTVLFLYTVYEYFHYNKQPSNFRVMIVIISCIQFYDLIRNEKD